MSRLRLHSERHFVAPHRLAARRCAGRQRWHRLDRKSIVGVAAASASHTSILLTGVAALVAGSMSMAAGEYVSVSSQSDTEQADLARERKELKRKPGI